MNLWLAVFFLFCFDFYYGQKEIEAMRINDPITLDGLSTEKHWSESDVAKDFVTNYPTFGDTSQFQTFVKVAYDDQAIYVYAEMHDPKPDSVLYFLSERDDFGNADWFGFSIDPWGQGQNAFGFCTTAAGVEVDAIGGADSFDETWNAVWKSVAVKRDFGWSVEFKIPYAQLRFSEESLDKWRINFVRHVRRIRQQSFWSPVDPNLYGEITQAGALKGVKNITPPIRLSFSPYATAYLDNNYDYVSGKQAWSNRQRFGMDMKLGLSKSFTLDATLIPDFGQTVSDQLLLNLTPFEIRYQENRPFFLEGIDLFGVSDIFYSRRIGASPVRQSEILDTLSNVQKITGISGNTQLLNSTKISGRTQGGWGIGFFNAIEGRSFLEYLDSNNVSRRIETHPLSNYNVAVVSKTYESNSSFSFINTNVYRADKKSFANVFAGSGEYVFGNKTYSLEPSFKISSVPSTNKNQLGHAFELGMQKVAGTYRFETGYYEMSDKYDHNDLGFLEVNNYRGWFGEVAFLGLKPKGRFIRRRFSLGNNIEYLYNPSKFSYFEQSFNLNFTTKKFLSCGVFGNLKPIKSVDFFESRSFGVPVYFPSTMKIGGYYSSDYSKKYALDINGGLRISDRKNMLEADISISPRFVFSEKLVVIPRSQFNFVNNEFGYAFVDQAAFNNEIILGNRSRRIVTNNLLVNYIFTNRIASNIKFNHYFQQVSYSSFFQLEQNGRETPTTYTGLNANGKIVNNTNFNAFTIDFNLRWVIYPGSEINFLWKYNIYAQKNGQSESYFSTFDTLFENPFLNSFSIRALFFLDAGSHLKRKL